MKKTCPLLQLLTVILSVSMPAAHAESLYISSVSVIPMDAPRIVENQDVYIRDGIIRAIADAGVMDAPAAATVIDGSGKFLIPGLSDMHAHVAGYAADSENDGERVSVAENELLLYLATGVTLLRDTAGSEMHFEVRDKLRTGDWLGPDLYFTSPVLEGEKNVWEATTKVLEAGQAEELVAGFAARGYWGIKIYHTISAPVFQAVIEAAGRHELPVVGHVPFEVGIDRALASGMRSIEHLRGYDFDGMDADALFADGGRSRERFMSLARMSDVRMDALVKATVANGVWNCPTLAIAQFLYDAASRRALTENPRYRVVHPELKQSVESASALDEIFSADAREGMKAVTPLAKELVRLLHEAGGGLVIGTDAVLPAWVPGFTPIDEMQAIADSGIGNFDVLQMATLNAARLLGIESTRGTIAVGKQASLIMLDENPVDDLDALWQLSGVIHDSLWLPIDELEKKLAAQVARFPADSD